jgi:hypothetical protein
MLMPRALLNLKLRMKRLYIIKFSANIYLLSFSNSTLLSLAKAPQARKNGCFGQPCISSRLLLLLYLIIK